MESSSIPKGVTRLYDHLRDCIRANNSVGVDETCRELLRAGRPLSEILSQGTLVSNQLKRLESEAPRSSLYYWGQQWSVRPVITERTQLPREISDRTIGNESRIENANSAAATSSESELLGASRADWVEEWQARQHLTDNASDITRQGSETVDDPGTLDESSAILDIAEEPGGPSEDLKQTQAQATVPRRCFCRLSAFMGVRLPSSASAFFCLCG